VGARPYRPTTWTHLLGRFGWEATVLEGPEGRDYLVLARRPAPSGPR